MWELTQSKKLISYTIRYSNHYNESLFKKRFYNFTEADVIAFIYKNNVDYIKLSEYCRVFSNKVPSFENLLTSEWESVNTIVSIVDFNRNKEEMIINGSGSYTESEFQRQYYGAYDLITSFEKENLLVIPDAIELCVRSLNTYLIHRATIWNEDNSTSKLIDSFEKPVTFEDKLVYWIPQMIPGEAIVKGDKSWNSYQKLKNIRDDIIHTKKNIRNVTVKDAKEMINDFKVVSEFYVNLMIKFKEKIPIKIIRGMCLPDTCEIEQENPEVSDNFTISDVNNPIRLMETGNNLISETKYNESIKKFDRAISLFPDQKYAYFYFHKAYALSNLKKYSEAIINYQTSIKYDGRAPELYFNLAYMHIKIGNFREALKNFKIAQDKNHPSNDMDKTIEWVEEQLMKS